MQIINPATEEMIRKSRKTMRNTYGEKFQLIERTHKRMVEQLRYLNE